MPGGAGPSNAALRKASKDYARKKVAAMFDHEDSNLEDHTARIPQFERSELIIGKVLGKGGYGIVKEIKKFEIHEGVRPLQNKKKNRGEEDPQVEQGERENRIFIAKHCIRNTGEARYAMKYLLPEVIEDPGKFVQAITDMAVETRFLSHIEHPNIVKLRAVANVDPFDETYFLVLDKLNDTLVVRMKKWASQQKRLKGLFGGGRKGDKANALLEERVVAAFDLCSALEYLHTNLILYRDVKPENIGFDVRGDIKIFDFGLSKELNPKLRLDDGTYKLTANTGSMVYMAPEIALGKPYNDTADVYSMTILMYEMLALKEAYPVTYTLKMYKEKVHLGGKRPKLDDDMSQEIKDMLNAGWHPDHIKERATMKDLAKMVRAEVVRVRGGVDEHGLEHERRRSSFIFGS